MRSRDGNRTLLLRLFIIFFFNSLALNAGEFLISYRYVVKDATLYNETLQISKAMKKCSGTTTNNLILASNGDKKLTSIINNNREKFIDYIHKLGLFVEHHEENINYQNHSTIILTLKTTCFKVDFNDNFVRMSPLN